MRIIFLFLFIASVLQGRELKEGCLSCDQAFRELVLGNKRFLQDKSIHPDRTAERRLETEAKQEPFAVIVGCSDSRVAPEIVFDQGIGNLFIVRDAGNVVGPVELDSIEYSVLYLHSTLIVVLGHENCGAVSAVRAGKTKDIESVARLIAPAIKKSTSLEQAIKDNVQMNIARIKKSGALSELFEKKKIAIVGGYYNFHSGEVEFLKSE